MQELRANTEIIVTVGCFVDVADGFTPQVDIALSGNEAELIKHGSTSVVDISGRTWAAVTDCRGHYSLTLTAADTNTEGMLVVIVQDDSDCLPTKQEYMVLAEAAWDSKYVAKDDGFMDVNLKTIGRTDTQETEANNLETICAAYTATRGLAGTALPAAVADASGGLPISDAGGLDLDNLTATLTAAGQQDIALAMFGRNTWYVDTNIGASGAGASWDTAFKTVAEAVSACAAGDKIMIGPGTYTEEVEAQGKANLEIVGAGLATHITTATDSALTITSGTVVRKMKLTSTDTAATDAGLSAAAAVDVFLQDLVITGTFDGAYCPAADRIRIDRCHIIGTYDALNISAAEDVLLTNSIFETDGSLSADNDARAVFAGVFNTLIGSGILRNCALTSARAAETIQTATAFGVVSSGNHYTLEHCILIATQAHASTTGTAAGVASDTGTGCAGDVHLVGCHIYTSQSGSGDEYHLSQASGVMAVSGTYYDTTKTLGTITDRPLDVLDSDALPELTGIADAPATPTHRQAMMLLYMWLRNDRQETATERRILNDAGTEILDATMSDDNTTFSAGKLTDA